MSAISYCGKQLSSQTIYQYLPELKKKCIYCFCVEISDFSPQSLNKQIAVDLMKKNGYPKCTNDYTAGRLNEI